MRTLFLALALILPTAVSAHGGAPSLESTTNGYLIDIGYDQIGIRPNEPVTFDFDLFTDSADAYVPFSAVQVEIEREGITVVDQTLENDGVNVPTTTITLEQSGEHILHASFMSGSTILAYDTFPLAVSEHSGALSRIINVLTYVAAAVFALIGVAAIISSYRRRKA